VKTLPPDLAARLAAGVTTLATCWRLTRTDGRVLGFTDHDRPIVYDGVTHEAATGFTASEATAHADLSVGGQEIDGALTSDAITAADIEAGLYDGAEIAVDLVDWSDPTQRLALRRGSLGDVSRLDHAFRAEVRSVAHALDETRGRLFQHCCDAELGDARCRVVVSPRAATVVEALDRRRFRLAGVDDVAAGSFDRGLARFVSGACAGRGGEIRAHGVDADGVAIDLWLALSEDVAPGDRLTLAPGCDKRFETCRDRFGNAVNFRGFPHIPGNDFLVASPAISGAVNDGGALVS